MIKIDCHAHANSGGLSYGLSNTRGTFLQSADELEQIYSEEGIAAGILMPLVSPEAQYAIISNDEVHSISKAHKNLLWCCNIDPRMIDNSPSTNFIKYLSYYKSKGAIGVGEITANLLLSDPIVENFLSQCAECQLPVTIHWANSLGKGYGLYGGEKLEYLESFLIKHPNLIIVGHSVPFWALFYNDCCTNNKVDALTKLMRKCKNLYCDTSANSGYNAMRINEDRAYQFLNEFSDRIMLGLDISYSGEKLYKKILDFYECALVDGLITNSTYAKICYKNAVKLYSLNEAELTE